MTKRKLAGLMEWLRPSGIGLVTFIVTAMLLFFSFSGANHAVTAFREGNRKPVNLLRPILSFLLVLLLLPPMIFALKQ